jgi:hypothetical protein
LSSFTFARSSLLESPPIKYHWEGTLKFLTGKCLRYVMLTVSICGAGRGNNGLLRRIVAATRLEERARHCVGSHRHFLAPLV